MFFKKITWSFLHFPISFCFLFINFPPMSFSTPSTFLLSLSALSVNDGIGSLSAAIEQCVLAFFLPLTCLTLQFTRASLRGLAVFPPSRLLSPASSLPFIKSQLLQQGAEWNRDSTSSESFMCLNPHTGICMFILCTTLSGQIQLVK